MLIYFSPNITIFVLNINSTIIKLRLPILALNSRRRLALWFYGRFGWIVSVIFRILDWIWFIHWYNDFPVGLCIEYLRSIDWENLAFGVWDCNFFVSFSAQKIMIVGLGWRVLFTIQKIGLDSLVPGFFCRIVYTQERKI